MEALQEWDENIWAFRQKRRDCKVRFENSEHLKEVLVVFWKKAQRIPLRISGGEAWRSRKPERA